LTGTKMRVQIPTPPFLPRLRRRITPMKATLPNKRLLRLMVFVGLVYISHARAQTPDPRLTTADVEKISGIKGIHQVAPGSVAGAGPGLNFAGPDKKMVLMVNFGPAALYQSAKTKTIPGTNVPLFRDDVRGIGDEAFDSPPGPLQYVLYV